MKSYIGVGELTIGLSTQEVTIPTVTLSSEMRRIRWPSTGDLVS